MQEIKCPKCGEVFVVDESGYAAIVKQVRDKEFEKEITLRNEQHKIDKDNAVKYVYTLAKLSGGAITPEELSEFVKNSAQILEENL